MQKESVGDIKAKLNACGLFLFGNKSILESKLALVESILLLANKKDMNGSWNVEEFDLIISLLPSDSNTWAAGDVNFVFGIVNSRSCASSILNNPQSTALLEKLRVYVTERLTVVPRLKHRVVTADSLLPMINALSKKSAKKWGQKEVKLLMENFADLHSIDGNSSSAAAVDHYVSFLGQLNVFYGLRPDIRAQIESC